MSAPSTKNILIAKLNQINPLTKATEMEKKLVNRRAHTQRRGHVFRVHRDFLQISCPRHTNRNEHTVQIKHEAATRKRRWP